MIPKKIHYCWFSGEDYPESVLKCMDSWKKYCPDYEIIDWNEDNFDIHANDYLQYCYENKKWAFVEMKTAFPFNKGESAWTTEKHPCKSMRNGRGKLKSACVPPWTVRRHKR